MDFIYAESWWNLLKVGSSTLRDRIWSFTKNSLSILVEWRSDGFYWRVIFQDKRRNMNIYENRTAILFSRCHDDIYWNKALRRYEDNLYGIRNAHNRFYWHRVMMIFIEEELFQVKRKTWIFTKSCRMILLAQSQDGIYWREALPR
jgi:hypothetical protein